MAEKQHDDELISIRKRSKREKKHNEKKRRPRAPHRVRATPRADGVKLDFTNKEPEVNRYWLGIAGKYRFAKIASVFVLAAFLLVMLIFYRENITYANLVYLVRDLDSEAAVEVGGYSDIDHERSQDSDYGLFRSRIAIASPQGFTLYSRTGSPDLESPDVIASPRLEVSDKYAVVYGAGEKRYSVFTTVAKVLSGESEYEIEDVALSDSGSYALLTKSKESRFMITVYDDSFKEAISYYKDSFVMDMAIDREGERITVVSSKVDGAEVSCEVMIGRIGVEKTDSFDYEGMMPIACEYTEDGRCVVLCDSGLLIFEKDKEIANVSFKGLTPGYFDICENTVAVSFATNVIGSENDLVIYSSEGEELFRKEIAGKISVVATDGAEAAYAVADGTAYRVSLKEGKVKKEECDHQVLYAMAPPGSLIVCTPEGTRSCFTD